MFIPKCKKCCHRCGGISPVKATDDMTQPVGQRDGQLYTVPVSAGIKEIEDTQEIVAQTDEDGKASLYLAQDVSNKLSRALLTPTQAPAEQKVVTVDTNGAQKMESYRNISPIAKTAGMTQSVGVDADGRLYTNPGGGGGAVDSVNGYTGDVTLTADDIALSSQTSETVNHRIVANVALLQQHADKIIALEAADLHPVAKSGSMTSPVGVDAEGKLFTAPVAPSSMYSHGFHFSLHSTSASGYGAAHLDTIEMFFCFISSQSTDYDITAFLEDYLYSIYPIIQVSGYATYKSAPSTRVPLMSWTAEEEARYKVVDINGMEIPSIISAYIMESLDGDITQFTKLIV